MEVFSRLIVDKERLVRVLTLQPRAPRLILNAHPQVPSVALFIRLKWFPRRLLLRNFIIILFR